MNRTILRNLIWAAILILIVASVLYLQKRKVPGVKIGVILATSGDASYIGKPEEDVLRKLLDQAPYANRREGPEKITLVFKDSSGKQDQARQYFEDFCNDPQVMAVIGPSTSGEAMVLAKMALENKMPLLALGASKKIVQNPYDPKKPNAWAFKFAQNDDLAADRLLLIIQEGKPITKIAFLFSDDGFGKSGKDVFTESAKKFPKVEISYSQAFDHGLNTPESVLAGLPQKDLDGVVIWGTSPGPALLVGSLRATRPDLAIYLSHGNASPAFLNTVGAAGEGVVVVGSRVLLTDLDDKTARDKVIRAFQEFWRTRFKTPPSQFAGYARDALESLLQVIGSPDETNRDSIRAGLERLDNFPGVSGTFRFSTEDHAGLDLSAFEVFRIKDGRFQPFDGGEVKP